ncbi:MAG: response regulator [Candidatus Omnitrophica bacterium]|nr:response regulator [Candidatus Omnitrophota bacterium]
MIVNGKKKVLIVDDEPDILKSVVFRVKKAGYDTLEASDGETCIDIARAKSPDLVLLDWRLPGKNGGEVYKELKAHEGTKDIPVIILTASRETENLDVKLKDIGIENVIIKPYEPSELIQKIKDLIG